MYAVSGLMENIPVLHLDVLGVRVTSDGVLVSHDFGSRERYIYTRDLGLEILESRYIGTYTLPYCLLCRKSYKYS